MVVALFAASCAPSITPSTAPSTSVAPTQSSAPTPTITPTLAPTASPTPSPTDSGPALLGFLGLTSSYTLVTSVDYDKGTISATETVQVTNTTDVNVGYLDFNIMPRAFGEFTLSGTPTVDGAPINEVTYSNNVTLVVPTPGFIVGETKTIVITFVDKPSAKVVNDLDQRLSRANGIMQAAQWFPIISDGHGVANLGDSQFTEAATDIVFDVTLARAMPLAAPGVLVSQSGLHYVYNLTNARDYAFAVSPNYHVATGTVNGITIKSFYTNGAGKTALSYAKSALATYASNYGAYPWTTYIIAQGADPAAGDEWPAMTTIGGSYLSSKYVVTHEVAHQWWYAIVGDDQINSSWLDEAFAEFSGRYFFGSGFSYNSTLAVNLPASAFSSFCCARNSYGQTIYYKGAYMLNALRAQMGTAAFFRAMRQIQTTYRFGIATDAGVIAIFEANSPNKAATDKLLRTYLKF